MVQIYFLKLNAKAIIPRKDILVGYFGGNLPNNEQNPEECDATAASLQ